MYLDVQIIGGTHRCAPADACIAQAFGIFHSELLPCKQLHGGPMQMFLELACSLGILQVYSLSSKAITRTCAAFSGDSLGKHRDMWVGA